MSVKSIFLAVAFLPITALAVVSPRGSCHSNNPAGYSEFSLREVGARNTLDWRMWLLRNGDPISFWHDVPLYPNPSNHQIISMIVEIPRWTNGKVEIRKEEPLNPIFHDEKKGLPRFVQNVWPHKTYPFLYGSVPQTWESPNFEHPFTGIKGDNDPIDVFDVGQDAGYTGQIKKVKLLGGLAVIDDDETDWKMLAIDMNDPIAGIVNNLDDLETYRPGTAAAFKEWFTYYKVPRGDGLLSLQGGEYQDVSTVVQIIEESHGYWRELIDGTADPGDIIFTQTSQPEARDSYISRCDTQAEFDIPAEDSVQPAEEMPVEFTHWYFLDGDYNLIPQP